MQALPRRTPGPAARRSAAWNISRSAPWLRRRRRAKPAGIARAASATQACDATTVLMITAPSSESPFAPRPWPTAPVRVRPEIVGRRRFGDDVGVFGVHVVEIGLVRARVAIADRLAHDQRDEAVAHAVDAGRAHAARRREPVMTSVSTPAAVSEAARLVPKKALGYCLETTNSSSRGVSPSAKRLGRLARDETGQRPAPCGRTRRRRRRPCDRSTSVRIDGMAAASCAISRRRSADSSACCTLRRRTAARRDRNRPARNRSGSAPGCGPNLRARDSRRARSSRREPRPSPSLIWLPPIPPRRDRSMREARLVRRLEARFPPCSARAIPRST